MVDGTNPTFTKERRKAAEAQAAKNVAARKEARGMQPEFSPSVKLITEALHPYLPAAPKASARDDRLVVVSLGRSFLFRPERYDISAAGDFTPKSETDFLEALRRFQNHMGPRPVFLVHLWRDTPEGRLKVGDYELK